MVWYGMVWYGTVWYGKEYKDKALQQPQPSALEPSNARARAFNLICCPKTKIQASNHTIHTHARVQHWNIALSHAC